jgi:hypothetical protein
MTHATVWMPNMLSIKIYVCRHSAILSVFVNKSRTTETKKPPKQANFLVWMVLNGVRSLI